MLFVVITGPSFEEAQKKIREEEKWAEGFELRLDTFKKRDPFDIAHLMKLSLKPFLFTLRKQSEGGFYDHGEEKRQEEIKTLLSLKPHFFDLEWDCDPSFADFSDTHLMISYHDFEKTPEDLEALLKQMKKQVAYAYKIATKANSTLDALRMLHFVKKTKTQGENITGLCMGEEGAVTRILGPVIGNLIDYACVDEKKAVAPGQISARTLCETYHYKKLKPSTHLYALIGDPVTKSASHISHNRVFDAFALNAVYLKMKVKLEELSMFFSLIHGLAFKGFSVTMPLKERLSSFLHSSEMKAINTLVEKEGKYFGYNTDGKGALDALEEKKKVKGKKLVILGAGGTARAIAFEALSRDAEVILCNRTEEKAKELALELQCKSSSLVPQDYDFLINTTSVGMAPEIDAMPISSEQIQPHTFIMDVIFNPKKTKLLIEAEKKGCTLIYGYEMWVYQAIAQFELWFQEELDREVLRKIILQGYFDFIESC